MTAGRAYVLDAPWFLGIEGSSWDVPSVAVNSLDEVHVLTRSPHPVLIFNERGRFLRSWGDGIFVRPHAIYIAADDSVFVVDSSDHTVRKFTPAGELLLTLGTVGRASDTGYDGDDYRSIRRGGPPFNAPSDVAVGPSGDIYVSDGYGNARVHRFTGRGELLQSWGEPGNQLGQFNLPHGIAIDREGRIYVADRENDRIQRFTAEGVALDQWTDADQPTGVFVTPDDRVVVAEMGRPGRRASTRGRPGRITIRDLAGRIDGRIGGETSQSPLAPGHFFAAHGTCVNRHGTIFVGEVISAMSSDLSADDAALVRPDRGLQVFRPA